MDKQTHNLRQYILHFAPHLAVKLWWCFNEQMANHVYLWMASLKEVLLTWTAEYVSMTR